MTDANGVSAVYEQAAAKADDAANQLRVAREKVLEINAAVNAAKQSLTDLEAQTAATIDQLEQAAQLAAHAMTGTSQTGVIMGVAWMDRTLIDQKDMIKKIAHLRVELAKIGAIPTVMDQDNREDQVFLKGAADNFRAAGRLI